MADNRVLTALETPREHVTYANILFWGGWGGLAILVVTYLLYVSGLIAPHVPLDKVTQLWSKPVHDYVTQGRVPQGWGWVRLLHTGDFLNFVGIAILAALTTVAFIPLIPAFLRKGNKLYAFIAVAEILVLVAAASGLISAGGH